ncbi:MAG TPA: hypothetical protein DC017_11125 [Candidatus Wallbacteria bacterium]|nr:hypothetical protein [Candidatus Wallbacteria bacterium]
MRKFSLPPEAMLQAEKHSRQRASSASKSSEATMPTRMSTGTAAPASAGGDVNESAAAHIINRKSLEI